MEDRLRRSAVLWRSVAGAALVLGIIGSIVIAIAVSKTEGYYGEETDVGVLVGVLLGSILGLMLSLGFFFIGTRIMDGIAELIERTPRHPAGAIASSASAARADTLATTPVDLASSTPEVPSPHTVPGWVPTHQVPNEGLIGEATKGQGGRATQLPGGSPVRLEERERLWAKVTDGYGGTFWVNGEKLIPLR